MRLHKCVSLVQFPGSCGNINVKSLSDRVEMRRSDSVKVVKIDHLVLTVIDIDITSKFYSEVLGMAIVSFGEGRKALTFGDQKINLHETGKEFEPKALNPTPGSIDLCFITNDPMEMVLKQLKNRGVSVIEGPVKRTGARGAINSVYINDPDGNLIEISTD